MYFYLLNFLCQTPARPLGQKLGSSVVPSSPTGQLADLSPGCPVQSLPGTLWCLQASTFVSAYSSFPGALLQATLRMGAKEGILRPLQTFPGGSLALAPAWGALPR